MIIGITKEIKGDEERVAILPSGVKNFVSHGHKVLVQEDAGLASGFTNQDYIAAGAQIVSSMIDVYKEADLMFKVKEVIREEYHYIREGQIFFGYYQTQDRPELTKVLLDKKAIVYSYERVENQEGEFPLLAPMSVIAGKVSAILGAYHLFNTNGGEGILIGGYPGIEPAKVAILGAGNSGLGALQYLVGLGAEVTLLDRNIHKLKNVMDTYPGVKTLLFSEDSLRKVLSEVDMLINSIRLKSGPPLLTRDMLRLMKPNSLIVNADGMPYGAIETARETTHDDPSYTVDGIKHISINNYPSAVTKTSTMALANSTTPYVLEVANKGWVQASRDNLALKNGLSLARGHLTLSHTAKLHGLDYTPVEEVLNIFSLD